VTLAWDAPLDNVDGSPLKETGLAGYTVHKGTTPGSYAMVGDIVGNTTTYTVNSLDSGQRYWFVVKAYKMYNSNRIESRFSSPPLCVDVP
jgi:hypothetical protein